LAKGKKGLPSLKGLPGNENPEVGIFYNMDYSMSGRHAAHNSGPNVAEGGRERVKIPNKVEILRKYAVAIGNRPKNTTNKLYDSAENIFES